MPDLHATIQEKAQHRVREDVRAGDDGVVPLPGQLNDLTMRQRRVQRLGRASETRDARAAQEQPDWQAQPREPPRLEAACADSYPHAYVVSPAPQVEYTVL